MALRNNEIRIVQSSMLGSILSNILLVSSGDMRRPCSIDIFRCLAAAFWLEVSDGVSKCST